MKSHYADAQRFGDFGLCAACGRKRLGFPKFGCDFGGSVPFLLGHCFLLPSCFMRRMPDWRQPGQPWQGAEALSSSAITPVSVPGTSAPCLCFGVTFKRNDTLMTTI